VMGDNREMHRWLLGSRSFRDLQRSGACGSSAGRSWSCLPGLVQDACSRLRSDRRFSPTARASSVGPRSARGGSPPIAR
jgi:hypothetical protein